jgi:hypothetical protein
MTTKGSTFRCRQGVNLRPPLTLIGLRPRLRRAGAVNTGRRCVLEARGYASSRLGFGDPREPHAEAERAVGPAADRSHLTRFTPA